MNHLEQTDRNYFWVERPKAVIKELQRHFEKVEDVTYVNDDSPSVMIDDLYQIYLPNGIRTNESQSNFYGVIRDFDMQNSDTQFFQWADTLDKAIDIVMEMVAEDKPIKQSEVAHRMRMIMDNLTQIKQQFSEEQLIQPTSKLIHLETHFHNIEVACNMTYPI